MTKRLAVLAGFATAAMIANQAAGQELQIAALPQDSPAHGLAVALAGVISTNARFDLRAVASERSSTALDQVDRGELAMAVTSAIDANLALHGTPSHEGRKLANLRILARLITYRAGFVVRRESDIRRVADFKGRRFPVNETGTGILEALARAAFATEGMNFKDIYPAPWGNPHQIMAELVAGRIEGAFLAPRSRAVREANASVKVRFLSLSRSPETAAVVRRVAPGAFFTVVRPAKRLTFIDRPTTILGVDILILTNDRVSSRVAYETARSLYLGRKSLIARDRLFRGFDPRLMGKKGIGPAYHKGAIRFYDEAGIW